MQGFGNVGSWAARLLEEKGGIIVAVSDASGCILKEDGLDVTSLLRHVKSGGTVMNFADGKAILGQEIFSVPCDVFVPAALGGVITGALPLTLPVYGTVMKSTSSPWSTWD